MVGKLISVIIAVIIAGTAAVAVALGGWPGSGSYSGSIPITSIAVSTPFNYNSGFPTKYTSGDTFFSTWADDGNIYVTANDHFTSWNTPSAGNNGSNISFSRISQPVDSTVSGTLINPMVSWGTVTSPGSDGATYKSGGMASIHGTLYWYVYRQFSPCSSGKVYGAQIIKSSDHGATWTPVPPSPANPYVSPMFTNHNQFMTFVQYPNQDYTGQTADNSANYVYGMISNLYNSPATATLARVKISNIANLNAADWTYYKGGNGFQDASWTTDVSQSFVLMTQNDAITSVQYFPRYNRYLAASTHEPAANCLREAPAQTSAQWWEAPHPWGPWTFVQNTEFFPQGHYFLQPVMSTVTGSQATYLMSGDFNHFADIDGSQANSQAFYSMWVSTITLNGGTGLAVAPTGSCQQSTDFLSRVYGYGQILDATHQTAYDNLICGLVTDNIWPKLDALYVFATQTPSLAQMNIVQIPYNGQQFPVVPAALPGVIITPSKVIPFTPDRGFTGEGLDSGPVWYIDSNFTTATGGANYQVQNAHVSAWNATNFVTASTCSGCNALLGVQDGVSDVELFASYTLDSNIYGRLNDQQGSPSGPQGIPASRLGHWLVSRDVASGSKIYQNGTLFSTTTGTVAAAVPINTMYLLAAFDSGNIRVGAIQQVAMESIGAALTGTNATAFYNRLRIYMTAVGVP